VTGAGPPRAQAVLALPARRAASQVRRRFAGAGNRPPEPVASGGSKRATGNIRCPVSAVTASEAALINLGGGSLAPSWTNAEHLSTLTRRLGNSTRRLWSSTC